MADELGKDGVLECEAMRNALAAAGISPHHIIMNCSAVCASTSLALSACVCTTGSTSASNPTPLFLSHTLLRQPSVIENVVRLVPVLRHLHIEHVHVVVSQLCLPRVQSCVDRLLQAAVSDTMRFTTQYHVAPDGLHARERALWEKIETRRLKDASKLHGALDAAVERLTPQQHHLDA